MKKEEKSQKVQDINRNVIVNSVQQENIQRFGGAIGEHVTAYSGVDVNGNCLKKSLDEISNYKIDPQYVESNIKQQAGYAAETKTVARRNAEKILRGEAERGIRTDDMMKQSDGKGGSIGGVNEVLHDYAEIDSDGIYIEGSARQLKFVGKNPRDCAKKILQPKWDKYRQDGTPIEVPKDFYKDVKITLSEKKMDCIREIKKYELAGDGVKAQEARIKLERVRQTESSLQKGVLDRNEAIEARLHPLKSTMKDIGGIAHQAGKNGAFIGAASSGVFSFIDNVVAVLKGNKKPEKAIKDTVLNTTKGAAFGYLTSATSATVTGIMQRSTSELCRTLSKSNMPAVVVSSVWEIGKSTERLLTGKIDSQEYIIELGDKGAGMVAGSYGAVAGQLAIPIPIVGALLGSIVGCALSSALYGPLRETSRSAKLAREERICVEKECQIAIDNLHAYQENIKDLVRRHFEHHDKVFSEAFLLIEEAITSDDFICGANRIVEEMGGEIRFCSQKEFDALMEKDDDITL